MKRFLKIAPLLIMVLTIAFCKVKKEKARISSASPFPAQNLSSAQAPVGLNLGNTAPEISLKNPAGKPISLYSLKGNVVLIDFWASWCGPCRLENPTVVKAYKSYHQKKLKGGGGFTIYSVSLDTDLSAWQRAIAKDSLLWDNHVSDLKGWSNEAAARYGVGGIPTNFLIDEHGIIIDKNLRGEALLRALDKLAIQ